MARLVDSLPLAVPWAIAVDPANLCNFQCQFCPTGDRKLTQQRPNGLMPFSLFKKIVDDIAAMGTPLKALKLWKDGEPLVNKELPLFIEYARRRNIAQDIRVTTNGALLSKMAKPLVDSGLDWIMISYMGPRDELYVQHTGRAQTRAEVIKGVEALRRARDAQGTKKPYIAVKMCEFPYITDLDIETFRGEFSGLADGFVVHEKPMNWDDSHGKDLTLGAQPRLTPKKVCPYAWYELNINFDGQVSICPVDWGFKTIIGDVRRESVAEVWNGQKMRDFRAMWARQTVKQHPACGNCNYYYYHDDDIDSYVLSAAAV